MRRRLNFILSALLAGVLFWTGAGKALDPAALAESIAGFRLVPWPAGVAGAFYLPWLELVTGGALLVPRWRAGAARVAVLLFGVFTAVWVVTWLRGIDVECGCFGGAGRTSVAWGLARALGLALLAWGCVRTAVGNQPPATTPTSSP